MRISTVCQVFLRYSANVDQATITDKLAALLTRDANSHKYDFGHILVIGGTAGMTGAPLLAAWAALRTGAGLVTIASENASNLQLPTLELMTHDLPGYKESAIEQLITFARWRKVSVILLGSGLGATQASFIRQLVGAIDLPLVLDAGGLIVFQGHLDKLTMAAQKRSIILTPHAGEFTKLSGQSIPTDGGAKQTMVLEFAKAHHLTLILKGHQTLVTSPDSDQPYRNETGNPGMATAGTGDVLAGITAGLLAQKLDPFSAAAGATYLHGLSGDLAVVDKTQPSLVASDLITYLPDSFRALS